MHSARFKVRPHRSPRAASLRSWLSDIPPSAETEPRCVCPPLAPRGDRVRAPCAQPLSCPRDLFFLGPSRQEFTPVLTKAPSGVHAAGVKGQWGSLQARPLFLLDTSAGLGCAAPCPHSTGSPRATAGKSLAARRASAHAAIGPACRDKTQRPPCGPRASRARLGLWPPVLPLPSHDWSRHFLGALAPAALAQAGTARPSFPELNARGLRATLWPRRAQPPAPPPPFSCRHRPAGSLRHHDPGSHTSTWHRHAVAERESVSAFCMPDAAEGGVTER